MSPSFRLPTLLLMLCLALPGSAALAAQTVLIFGDSLSAGYGLGPGQSWPALLAQRLQAAQSPWTIANASISGETTAGGRSRLPSALERFKPAVAVIALGANDGLRGLPPAQMRDNLSVMIRAAKARGAKVLLAGILLPPNYGADYTARFVDTYRQVAAAEKVPLLPFLLEPIAQDMAAFQADGLHPTASAQPKILDHVWQALQPLLAK